MTNPDPLAELAAQVEDLRGQLTGLLGQLARSQGDLGALRAKLEQGSGQEAMLRLELKQLRERLEEAISRNLAAPPPAPWWVVSEAEGRAMLAELCEWVDRFLRPHYPGYVAKLPSCWFHHFEAVWELSTVMTEWQRVYGDGSDGDLQGALAWHDRWFPDALSRVTAAIECDATGCRALAGRPRA